MLFVHGIDIDVEYVIRSIPGVATLMYDDISMDTCDCKKDFK